MESTGHQRFSIDFHSHPGTNQCSSSIGKVRGANMWPIWGRQDPGGPHVGPMNFVIWVGIHGGPTETGIVNQGAPLLRDNDGDQG